jgi:hypothetical protein
MKITLGLGINYSGYENLGFVKTLDPFVMNAECTEILALGVIDYIEIERVEVYIQHLVSKLRHKGKLVITGRDMFYFANLVVTQPGNVDLVAVNKLIYGELDKRPYASQTHVNHVAELLQKFGLKILRKSLEAGEYVVEAERL